MCFLRPYTPCSHFRSKTYKALAQKFAVAAARIRKRASADQLVSRWTSGFRSEIDPVLVVKGAIKLGFDASWLDCLKKKKHRLPQDRVSRLHPVAFLHDCHCRSWSRMFAIVGVVIVGVQVGLVRFCCLPLHFVCMLVLGIGSLSNR